MVRARDAKEWAKSGGMGITWAPLTTPFTTDFEIDEPALRENARHCIELGVDGVYPGGHLSEPYCLTNEQRMHALEVYVDEVRGKKPVYAYPVSHSLPETIRMAQHAQSADATFIMVNPPFEHVKSPDSIYQFFEILADKTDIAISIWNTPHSGFVMPPQMIARLANIPAVCAVKNIAGTFEHSVETWRLAGDRIQVNPCLEGPWFKAATEYPGMGLFLSTTSVFLMQAPGYTPVQKYINLTLEGKLQQARSIRDSLAPLRELWQEMYAVYITADKDRYPFSYHPIAGIKCWEDYLGMHGGPVKPPTISWSQKQKEWLWKRLDGTSLAAYAPSRLTTKAKR